MTMIKIAHHPGRHCGSTSLCNLVNFHGIPWSEAMCFGIGCGLGIWYIAYPGMSPSRLIHVRSADLEEQFFTRIGVPFAWEKFPGPEEGERALRAALDRGRPVLLQTDIFHLPYYQSKTHFPGHDITAWGYDDARKVFFITDTERPEAQEVPYEAMRLARWCEAGFFKVEGNLCAPERISAPPDLPAVLRRAIADNSRALLGESMDFQGLAGLEKWRRELPEWAAFPDWQWNARFTYQVIEKRGTGGGGFRLMYGDFLREAGPMVPMIGERGLPELMAEAARAWSALAEVLREASDKSAPDFGMVSEKLALVRDRERAYHMEASRPD